MPDLLAELHDALGPAVTTDADDLESARRDKSGWTAPGRPVAVVRADATDQVSAALRIASRHGVSVVVRGAGTGLAGGAAGGQGVLVLDVSGLDRVLEISVADEYAVVEAGVLNDDLNRALAPHGLWYTPDPASKAISSVGGNIATNAGGLLCAKYGVTRDSVMGLTVVLADGRVIRTGHRTVKGVTGYDLTGLFVGSEGTLGVIVEAVLRVRPARLDPPVTLGAFFADVVQASAAAAAVTAAGIRPAAMELMDPPSVAAVRDLLGPAVFDGLPEPVPGETLLVVQTDGPAARAEATAAASVLGVSGGRVVEPSGPDDGERLMRIRRSVHPAFERLGLVLIEDVSVPRSRMPEMFAAIDRISSSTGLAIPTVAHAGDGNLHPNVVVPVDEIGEDGAAPERVWDAASQIFREALRLGGTLTGEHGVGVLKRRWLRDELGDDQYALQRSIKTLFDPEGILGPGTMFEAAR